MVIHRAPAKSDTDARIDGGRTSESPRHFRMLYDLPAPRVMAVPDGFKDEEWGDHIGPHVVVTTEEK